VKVLKKLLDKFKKSDETQNAMIQQLNSQFVALQQGTNPNQFLNINSGGTKPNTSFAFNSALGTTVNQTSNPKSSSIPF
jgi:hypothetical protein